MNVCRVCGKSCGNDRICDTCKAWEITVRNFGTKGTTLYQSPWAESILAADAELKRLREAVEWALNEGCAIAQNKGWDAYEAELRRKAKG